MVGTWDSRLAGKARVGRRLLPTDQHNVSGEMGDPKSDLTLVAAAAWSLYDHVEVSGVVIVWLGRDAGHWLIL